MGMDVYGLSPKENKSIEEFPTYKKFNNMDFGEKWRILDKNEKLKEKYFKEQSAYEEANCGRYFRNNCWWWRPLWNYCYAVADDIISQEVWNSGHCNDGAGLNKWEAKALGERLLATIDSGECVKYQAEYMQRCQEDVDAGDKFGNSYPFDVENVKSFANFCIESGGFEIC